MIELFNRILNTYIDGEEKVVTEKQYYDDVRELIPEKLDKLIGSKNYKI